MNHVNMRLRGARIPYTQGLPDQLVSSLVWNGQLGVQIFFAVSGFLITTTALNRWGQGIDIRAFYGLRFARIAPLLLILLVILSTLDLAQVKNYVINPKVATLPRALFAALTFHINVLEANHGYLPGNWDILWSLSVEEVFYLVFPLVRRHNKLFVGLLLTCIVLGPFSRTHGNAVWKEYSYLGGMDAIAMGCVTALLVSRIRFQPRILVAAGAPLMIFCLCFSRTAERWGLERTGLTMTILAVGACMIIAASAQTQWKSPRILRPLLDLGQRSYEVYLTHMFVVFAFFQLFMNAGKPMKGVPILFIATILVSGLVGEVVARFYSEPLNRLLRRGRLVSENMAHDLIQAAGGVISRTTKDGREFLLVHRKRYGDWTLPKGKLKSGETHEEAALREVREETGYATELVSFLGEARYEVKGVPKIVRFWNMRPVGHAHEIEDRGEVEKIAWMSAKLALERLDYPLEKELLERAIREAAE
jgi:peptidoglycan/LPS O-acetylase OafA/YrhL